MGPPSLSEDPIAASRLLISLDPRLRKSLDRFCKQKGASRAFVISEALEWYLRARENMNRPDFVEGMQRTLRAMLEDAQGGVRTS